MGIEGKVSPGEGRERNKSHMYNAVLRYFSLCSYFIENTIRSRTTGLSEKICVVNLESPAENCCSVFPLSFLILEHHHLALRLHQHSDYEREHSRRDRNRQGRIYRLSGQIRALLSSSTAVYLWTSSATRTISRAHQHSRHASSDSRIAQSRSRTTIFKKASIHRSIPCSSIC